MLLSVIIPMLNEEEVCLITLDKLSKVLKDVNHELIFIDDGSTDKTLELLQSKIDENSPHRVISFSRNFGHQAAFSAGIEYARGDCTVIIDGDLQDPPELIHEMIVKWKEGYQVVYAQRKKRMGETLFKLFTAKWFYRILNSLTSVDIPVDTGDYRLMDRAVVDELKSLPERSRFLRGLVCWIGFKHTGVRYERAERFAGETKYPLKKMLHLAADGLTSFSTLPLKISFVLGSFATALAFLIGIWAIVERVLYPATTSPGWASIMITILFLGGCQLITLGIIGEYIGRIFDEVKARPIFIVEKVIGK
jgi:polyisoprenyl-phosphate glycosyltransferase